MSDFLQPNRGYVYVNGSAIGDKAPTDNDLEMLRFPQCEIKFKFPDALIKQGNQYSVSLQRFEVPLQLLPCIHSFPNCITITDDQDDVVVILGAPMILDLPECYTLFSAQQHIRDFCNNFVDQQGEILFQMYLTPDLRWKVQATNHFWKHYNVTLSDAFQRWCNLAKGTFSVHDLPVLPDNDSITAERIEQSYASVTDTYNRIRKLNFQTDLFIQMEVQGTGVGYSMTRLMTDYIIPKTGSINYSLNSGGFANSTASFSEFLPQTITFSATPQSVRWSPLVTDQPIYNFRVRCTAAVFNWQTMAMDETMIPLPLAAEFTVKILFATKSEVPVVEG